MHARERFVATLEELENRIFTEESDPRIRNFRLIDESPRLGAEGKRIAFLHPSATAGVLVELSEY